MKKLIAVLLSCVLMLTLSVPAMGESCYELLKGFLSETDDDLTDLGQPIAFPSNEAGHDIVLVYNEKNFELIISGANASGKGEMCIWENVEALKVLRIFYVVCSSWDTLSDFCDKGYSMILSWDYGAQFNLFIYNQETATDFLETFWELYEALRNDV